MHSKYLLITVLLFNFIYSQIDIKVENVIELPDSLNKNSLNWTNISVGTTGYYLLDNANRQVAFISKDNDIIYSGGYGFDNDAFIDPIDILSSKLDVWIIDSSENKLLKYDHKLNYLKSIEFEQLYPIFGGIDDWGNIYLLSELEQIIYKADASTENLEEFIDLSFWDNLNSCISDMHVAWDGSIGILSKCTEYVYIFNRLGKLQIQYPISYSSEQWLVKINNNWFALTSDGKITSIQDGYTSQIIVENPIINVFKKDKKLYLLHSNKIWIVNVAVD